MPLRDLTVEVDWLGNAACLGTSPGLFYDDHPHAVAAAKAVCATCPVQPLCLDHALATREEFGVWGGLTEPERRRLTEAPRRRGRERRVSDHELERLFANADPRRRALDVLADRVDLGDVAAYKVLRRAQGLGLVERRGRYLHPR